MRKLVLFILFYVSIIAVRAQDNKERDCDSLVKFTQFCLGEEGIPMNYDTDTSFTFTYLKNDELYTFCMKKSGDDIVFKKYVGFANEKCILKDIDKKFIPELLQLYKRYKDWIKLRYDKSGMPDMSYIPEGTNIDSLLTIRKNAKICDGYVEVKYLEKLKMDLLYEYDTTVEYNKLDVIRNDLILDLKKFAQKIK